VIRVWLVFVAVLGGQLAVFAWGESTIGPWANRWTAWMGGLVLRGCGVEAWVEDDIVYNSLSPYRVIWECTGLTAIALFIAAVAAYPSRWRAKLWGLVLGIPLLLAINQLRLVTLVAIDHWWPSIAETAHVVVWQSLFILLTVVLWLVWVVRVADRRGGEPA
jgi:exosortase/archaeosortase family protein